MNLQAYKHVFTLPSSVDHNDIKATQSGNAHIHGMTCVTTGSLAYIATQVSHLINNKHDEADLLDILKGPFCAQLH
jgi:hypothetical protein